MPRYVYLIFPTNWLNNLQVSTMAADEEDLIRQIEDELKQPLTDPVKESTVDFYLKNKDKVFISSSYSVFKHSLKFLCYREAK